MRECTQINDTMFGNILDIAEQQFECIKVQLEDWKLKSFKCHWIKKQIEHF